MWGDYGEWTGWKSKQILYHARFLYSHAQELELYLEGNEVLLVVLAEEWQIESNSRKITLQSNGEWVGVGYTGTNMTSKEMY